ncbi:MAG: hypothetical protein KF810_08760 [Rhizobiaceae bacterium]|nr:hypothetical protein [Rhizobiaceae bacterium]
MRNLVKFSPAAIAVALVLSGQSLAQEAPATQPPPAAMPAPPTMPAPYDCTLTEAVICKAGATCTPAKTLGELPLPARVLVHFEDQVLATVGPNGLPHISKIADLSSSGDIVVAQGVDGGTGWMLHATSNDDEVTFVAASDDFILNAFGTCKPVE